MTSANGRWFTFVYRTPTHHAVDVFVGIGLTATSCVLGYSLAIPHLLNLLYH